MSGCCSDGIFPVCGEAACTCIAGGDLRVVRMSSRRALLASGACTESNITVCVPSIEGSALGLIVILSWR